MHTNDNKAIKSRWNIRIANGTFPESRKLRPSFSRIREKFGLKTLFCCRGKDYREVDVGPVRVDTLFLARGMGWKKIHSHPKLLDHSSPTQHDYPVEKESNAETIQIPASLVWVGYHANQDSS